METRANFVLIGAFTIAGLLGILAFFLWFARIELDRQFAYYDIRFSSVSGLGNASDVRFSGFPVGQVVDVKLSPDRDGTILVRVEVDAETPVRTNSIATIEPQGVTGVSFVGIAPGTPSAPMLEPTVDKPVPEIIAGRSTLQTLSEDFPRLLESSLNVVDELGNVLSDENRDRLNAILTNIEAASANFATSLESFSAISETVADFADQISLFNESLGSLTEDLTDVLANADTTLVSVGELSEQGKGVLTASSETLASTKAAIERAQQYMEDDLTLMTNDLQQTSSDLRAQISVLGQDARAMMATLETTGKTATARLEESQATLAAADVMIARVDAAATSVSETSDYLGELAQNEGAPLLKEARSMVTAADKAIQSAAAIVENDLPTILADVRSATETSKRVIAEVGENLTRSSKSVEEVLAVAKVTFQDASVTFGNANQTLAQINDALETGDRALGAAEKAFIGADRVINEDLTGIVSGLETSIANFNSAISQVSEDLPAVTADIRAASGSAAATFAELRRVTNASAPSVQEFTTSTLPLFARLAQESRALIANLDRLTNQVQNDPTRFLLNRGTSEFRR